MKRFDEVADHTIESIEFLVREKEIKINVGIVQGGPRWTILLADVRKAGAWDIRVQNVLDTIKVYDGDDLQNDDADSFLKHLTTESLTSDQPEDFKRYQSAIAEMCSGKLVLVVFDAAYGMEFSALASSFEFIEHVVNDDTPKT